MGVAPCSSIMPITLVDLLERSPSDSLRTTIEGEGGVLGMTLALLLSEVDRFTSIDRDRIEFDTFVSSMFPG